MHVQDMSLQDYIAVKEKGARYLPHSAARYASKRFKKAQCPIVERMVNSLMMHGRNNGKKLMTVRIVKHSFEIIHLTTGENPLQVLIFQFLFKLLYFYPSAHFFSVIQQIICIFTYKLLSFPKNIGRNMIS